MRVYIDVVETVVNRYEVLGVSSEEELKNLMENYSHNNIWAYEEGLILEHREIVEFIETNFESVEAYEE